MLYQQTANVHFLVPLDFSLSSGPPLPLFARKQINWCSLSSGPPLPLFACKQINWCRQGVRVWQMFKVALNWNDTLVNFIPYIWKTNLTIHSFETTAQWLLQGYEWFWYMRITWSNYHPSMKRCHTHGAIWHIYATMWCS